MNTIISVIAPIAICGAAYFSYDLSQKYDALEKDRVATVNTLKDTLTDIAIAEKGVKEETAKLNAAKEKRDSLEQAVSALKSSGKALNSDVATLKKELKAQEEEFIGLEKALEEVNSILANLGGGVTLETLPAKIQEIENDKVAKQAKVEEFDILIKGATKSLETTMLELDSLDKRRMERNQRIAQNSMEAVITAVDQEWGFVVVGAGSNSNFSPQSSLIVERDGTKIARIRPSAIEATQTIANIELNTLRAGARIQPGDRVILADLAVK